MQFAQVNIKKILYATDLSESAKYAFAYAVSLANQYDATLTLLHVLPEVPDVLSAKVIGYISSEQWDDIKSRHFQDAQQALIGKRKDHRAIQEVLDQFCKNTAADAAMADFTTDEVLVQYGNPAKVILETAKAKDCDLIVMGTHGFSSLADVMIGSTARRVVRRSSIPVLVVRLPEEP